ncbi:MAG: tetratricopeptide repeat protein [Pirellulales bacterium]
MSRALVLRAELTEDPDKQQADLDRAVKAAGTRDKEILRSRGIFYLLKRNDAKSALTDFDAAAKIDPEDGATHHLRGLTLMELNQPHEAVEALDKAIALGNKNPQTRLQLARAKMADKDGKGALAELDKLLDAAPGNPAVLLMCRD